MNDTFPKFYRHTNKADSDAMFVRFDNAEDDCVVITTSGRERLPNHSPWPLEACLMAEAMDMAVEITSEEAGQLVSRARNRR